MSKRAIHGSTSSPRTALSIAIYPSYVYVGRKSNEERVCPALWRPQLTTDIWMKPLSH
jgi:hypothetical protein